MKHTRISNNNGAFASVVNECEKTRDLSSLFQVFCVSVCVCSVCLKIDLGDDKEISGYPEGRLGQSQDCF